MTRPLRSSSIPEPSSLAGRRRRPGGAGLRPPPKLDVRFSRIQLSQRRFVGRQGRYQQDKIYKPQLAEKLAVREVSPPRIAPALKPMRPYPPHDPAFEPFEETTDMGLAVIKPPSTNDRIDLSDQIRCCQRSTAPCTLDDLVLEMADGLVTWKSIKLSLTCPATDLAGTEPQGPLAALDLQQSDFAAVANRFADDLTNLQQKGVNPAEVAARWGKTPDLALRWLYWKLYRRAVQIASADPQTLSPPADRVAAMQSCERQMSEIRELRRVITGGINAELSMASLLTDWYGGLGR